MRAQGFLPVFLTGIAGGRDSLLTQTSPESRIENGNIFDFGHDGELHAKGKKRLDLINKGGDQHGKRG
ncbi:MAG: hypothetical protein AMJ94_02095 [Deltaproteobacteria bacterium SM23_61]|nr:MAG: hypothetical protein AMJ94_02095 [Deltaproteobacteria bacterium SM23_61]